MTELYIFWHIYCSDKNQIQSNIIVKRQWKRIEKSGILDKIEKIIICKVGNVDIDLKILYSHPKIKIIDCGLVGHEYETTSRLHKWCIHNFNKNKNDVFVLYLHNRGSSRSPIDSTHSWTQCMEHYVITRHNECISQLEANKLTVGCALKKHFFKREKSNIMNTMSFLGINNRGVWHYSGNFWWSKASYIATLREPHKTCRFRAGEDWIVGSVQDHEIDNHYCLLRVPKSFDSYKMKTPSNLYEAL